MAEGKVCWKIIREDARNSANWLQGVYLSINSLTTTTVHLWLREAYPFSSRVAERLTDLDSSQEEADTRLLSHAAHAARSRFVAIIIVSEDTDILVVCLAFKSHIQSSMFLKCSFQTTVKYLDVNTNWSKYMQIIAGIPHVYWLGREWQLSNEFYSDFQRFTCAMYRNNAGTSEVNELRYRFFCWGRC